MRLSEIIFCPRCRRIIAVEIDLLPPTVHGQCEKCLLSANVPVVEKMALNISKTGNLDSFTRDCFLKSLKNGTEENIFSISVNPVNPV